MAQGHQHLKSGALRVLPPTPKDKAPNRGNTHTHTPEFVLTDVGEAQRLENLLLDTAGGAVAAAWVDPKVAKHISLSMRPWKSTQMRRASMILRYGWIAAATASWACKTELYGIWRQSRSQATYGRLRFQAVCCLCKSWRGKIPAQLELEAPTLVSRSGGCQHTAETTTHPHTVKSWPLHATRVHLVKQAGC